MRNLLDPEVDQFRLRTDGVLEVFGSHGGAECGCFMLPSVVDGQPLRIIASAGGGWDHVSVSRKKRMPNWPEMEQVKRLFFADHETAMQLHVPVDQHINWHPNCLHLWRPIAGQIPMPPASFVGPQQRQAPVVADE